jgi:hypothetical protein
VDDVLRRALAAGARSFADVLDEAQFAQDPDKPVAGSAKTMYQVLSSVARINDDERRGATEDESRSISRLSHWPSRADNGTCS